MCSSSLRFAKKRSSVRLSRPDRNRQPKDCATLTMTAKAPGWWPKRRGRSMGQSLQPFKLPPPRTSAEQTRTHDRDPAGAGPVRVRGRSIDGDLLHRDHVLPGFRRVVCRDALQGVAVRGVRDAPSPGMSGLPAKGEKDDEDLQLVDKLVTLGLGVCAFCVTPTLRMCCTKKPLLCV